jgi:transposase
MPDEDTLALRRLVARRTQLSRQRTRATNQLHAVLIRNVCLERPSGALLSKQGRAWLESLELPADERLTLDGCITEADFLAAQREQVEAELAKASARLEGDPQADDDPGSRRHRGGHCV